MQQRKKENQWYMENKSTVKHNNSITKSMILVSIASTLTLVFSFLKETVTANYFGTSAASDAYIIAVQLPVVLFSTVSMAVSTVVIPVYSKKYVQESKENANNYASNLITILVCIAAVFTVISIIFAEQILKITAPGLTREQTPLAVSIFRSVVPTVICTIVIKVNTGVMNFHNEFTKPVLAINFLNIPFSIIVILFAKQWGITAAVVGILVGTSLEFIASCIIRRRYMKYRFIFNVHDSAMRNSIRMSIPVLIGIGVDELGKVFDKMIASMLETGSVSSLNYASRLSTAISSLLLSGISTVTFPEYTKNVAEGNNEEVSKVFLYSIRIYIILVLPIVVGGIYLSKEIIMIVFCRGAFDMNSVMSTAPLFCWYLISMFFSATRITCSNLYYAYGDTKTPMVNSSIGIIINIILNFLLSIKFGAIGIAAATAIATAIVCVSLLINAKGKNTYINYNPILMMLRKIFLGIIAMLMCLICIKYLFMHMGAYNLHNVLNNICFVLISVFVGSIVYFAVLSLLKCEGLEMITKKFFRKR